MDKSECGQAPSSALKKGKKKKKAKDEIDRLKQAEKKKRRLEKALATSAAIRSQLEKKRQMKKEEQQRLDDEGAAIAESVALHVLGGEELDDPTQIMLSGSDDDFFDGSRSFRLFIDPGGVRKFTSGGLSWIHDSCISRLPCNYDLGIQLSSASETRGRQLQAPLFDKTRRIELLPGAEAANAFSALQISEASLGDSFVCPVTAAAVFNRMMQSNRMRGAPTFHEEYWHSL